MSPALRGPVLITGTDTGVGKTVVTAAIAAAAGLAGLRVAVVKPAQTGVAAGEESDVDAVRRLASPASARTLVGYRDALAPLAAARVSGKPPLPLVAVVDAVREAARDSDLVLIEGAGGLLVPLGLDPHGPVPPGPGSPGTTRDGHLAWTAVDLASALGTPAVVVARAGLGTLNHTALTLEALRRRDIPARVVIGSWPTAPELVHRTNLHDLAGELAGVVPDGVGSWPGERFRSAAPSWLAPDLYGTLEVASWQVQAR